MRNHTVVIQGQATIADRPSTIGEIRSRASGKLVRRIWVDREKGVVLRTELYNWASQLVSSTEFQHINYDAQVSEKDFEVDKGSVSGPKIAPIPVPEEDLRKPGYMPQGFELVGKPSGVRTMRGVAVHLRYGDGLNAISIFVRKLQPNEDPKMHAPMPGVGGPFSAVVHHVKGDYRVTIIGDVSPAELRRIAESVD
jgi:sigma-E factor negative regulatory protein RseB